MFPKTKNSGFPSHREAHNAAMDFMLDRSGTPEDLSTTDGSVMYEGMSSRWENFHRNQGHAIKYEDDQWPLTLNSSTLSMKNIPR